VISKWMNWWMDSLVKAWLDTMRAQYFLYLLHCGDKNKSDQTFVTSLLLQTPFVLAHKISQHKLLFKWLKYYKTEKKE
jgi:hypothetical protein